MILQCPKCDTRFLIDSAQIPAQGCDVRCARCEHQWFAENKEAEKAGDIMSAPMGAEHPEAQDSADDLDEAHDADIDPGDQPAILPRSEDGGDLTLEFDGDEEDEEEEEMPNFSPSSASLPKPKPEPIVPLLGVSALLFVAIIVTSLYTFRHAMQPAIPGLYAMLGMTQTDGLVLADVAFRKRPARNKARFVVEGYILNQSDVAREIPTLRVVVADAMGEPIVSKEYVADQKMLKAGESYAFKASGLDTSFVNKVDHLVVDLGNSVQLMLRD